MTMDRSQNFVKQKIKVRALDEVNKLRNQFFQLQLINEYIGSKIIHYANFDIEGYEQHLIDGLYFNETLTQKSLTFCQVFQLLINKLHKILD